MRDRRDDIPFLADHILRQVMKGIGHTEVACSEEALDALVNYGWPGNVRELQNAIYHARVKCKGNTIEVRHLPETISHASGNTRATHVVTRGRKLKLSVEAVRRVLRETQGNKREAAEKLGVSRATLYKYLEVPTSSESVGDFSKRIKSQAEKAASEHLSAG